MIFYLIYYLFMVAVLISCPYLASQYILAGDPYLLVNSSAYFYAVLTVTVFLISYLFNMTNHLYYCFVDRWSDLDGLGGILSALHGVTVATFYNSAYMTIGAMIGFAIGNFAMESVSEVKELLLSVIHLPGFEFFLKGVPLAIGGMLANIFAGLCVNVQCS